ncbi:MAG: hypothetical protein OFPII_18920 [Osedax symbiont Rs1]|nr:MAG: hypothetical protein OFPII_18920 [Osedax symbiont Rs1]
MASNQNYDSIIADHYKKVAQLEGDNLTSTMTDIHIREKETEAIVNFIDDVIKQSAKINQTLKAIDAGCGNGYTLKIISELFPNIEFTGIEKSQELREIAIKRFENTTNVSIISGDIRDLNFSNGLIADIFICQRVLINLLDVEDQKLALSNINKSVVNTKENGRCGYLLFIESFSSPLKILNEAREEFDLAEMKPAHHNLYLEDDFFEINQLTPYSMDNKTFPSNFLSTHYYITRVLHPHLTRDKQVKRNSHFVSFFSQALKRNSGNYSPLQLKTFKTQ